MKRIVLIAASLAVTAGCKPPTVTATGEEPPPGAAVPPPDAAAPPDSAPSSEAPDADFVVSWPEAGAAPPDASAIDQSCGLQTVKLERRPAELMLVLDRSGSMNDPAAPGALTTKWT